MQASRLANTSACVRRQGESPGNQIMLLNSVLAELAAQGSMRASARIRSRASPRGRNTVWVVFADSEKDLRWLRLPWVPRPACAFGAKSPKGGYRSSSVPKWR